MNKAEYLNELRERLSSLSKEDRGDAIDFYDEYLSDLEEKNPGEIEALDEPARVAAGLKADAAMKGTQIRNVKDKRGISAVWAVLLGILALPIGVPLAVAIAALAIALIVVALSLVISLFGVAFSIIVSAITAMVSGLSMLFTTPPVGIFYLGCGLLGLGLGYIFSIWVYGLSKSIFVWIARFINKLRMKMQNKRSKGNEVTESE